MQISLGLTAGLMWKYTRNPENVAGVFCGGHDRTCEEDRVQTDGAALTAIAGCKVSIQSNCTILC